MKISAHFTIEEFAVSADHPELVVPVPGRFEPMLRKLVDTVLEPLRVAFGGPVRVLSGYRSLRLNRAIGGSITSQHTYAEAADLTPANGRRALALFDVLRQHAAAGTPLPHGQAIWYPDQNFVHIALDSLRYPTPTFCVHWPERGFTYRVIDADAQIAHLATLAASAA